MILIILIRARITSSFIISITFKLRMHGAGVNAAGTKLLDRFGHIRALNRKGAVRKNRKSEGIRFVLWLLTSWKSNGGRSETYLNSYSAKRTYESDVLFNLKSSLCRLGRTLCGILYKFFETHLNSSTQETLDVESLWICSIAEANSIASNSIVS